MSHPKHDPLDRCRSALVAFGYALIGVLSLSCTSTESPQRETTGTASQAVILTPAVREKQRALRMPIWENIPLAVPRNKANCGPNGGAFISNGGPSRVVKMD